MNTNNNNENSCNSMLRGELSAIETYSQAIAKFASDPGVTILTEIRASHIANEGALRRIANEYGAESATSSGPWGTFATSVEGIATLLGKSPALIALQQGEEHGVNQYERAIEDSSLDEKIKDFIKNTLLPSQRKNLAQLALCKSVLA
ncbi:MAG: DUF2383 domain-containing protein [Luteolibacter sp.]